VTTAKGKLSAEVFISALENALLVDAEEEVGETLRARLERYVVADDVVIEDATETYGLLHFLGVTPGDVLPADVLARGHLRRASRLGSPGWDLVIPREEVPALLEKFANADGARLVSGVLTETIRLEAGVPRWGRDFGEETLPPEAGLDRTHVDYAKGCYIGQEVISRLKSVGHVNRRLTGFVADSGEPLAAGWQLYAAGDEEKAVGSLTSAGWSFALAKPVALGYLKRGSPTANLFARPADRSASAVEVSARELPFAPPPFSA